MVLKNYPILFIWIKIWSIFVWICRKSQTKGRSFSTKVVSGNILLSYLDIALRQYVLFLNTVTCMIYVEFQKQWSSKFTNSFSKFASRIQHLMIAFCSWHFLPNMPCNMVQTKSYFVKSFTGEASEGFNCILNKMKQLMVWVALLLKALLELSRKKKIYCAPTALQANLLKYLLLSHSVVSDFPWIATLQAPLSMGFSRKEYWSGVPFPCPT